MIVIKRTTKKVIEYLEKSIERGEQAVDRVCRYTACLMLPNNQHSFEIIAIIITLSVVSLVRFYFLRACRLFNFSFSLEEYDYDLCYFLAAL